MTDEATEGGESVRDRMIDGPGTEEACSVDTSQAFCRRGETQQGELSHILPWRVSALPLHSVCPTQIPPSPSYSFSFYSFPSVGLPFSLLSRCSSASLLHSSRMWWQNFPGICCVDEPPEPLDTHQHSRTSIHRTHVEWINSTSPYQPGLKGWWWKIKLSLQPVLQSKIPYCPSVRSHFPCTIWQYISVQIHLLSICSPVCQWHGY